MHPCKGLSLERPAAEKSCLALVSSHEKVEKNIIAKLELPSGSRGDSCWPLWCAVDRASPDACPVLLPTPPGPVSFCGCFPHCTPLWKVTSVPQKGPLGSYCPCPPRGRYKEQPSQMNAWDTLQCHKKKGEKWLQAYSLSAQAAVFCGPSVGCFLES